MIQDLAASFIIRGLLSFGRHLSSGRGLSAGTFGGYEIEKGRSWTTSKRHDKRGGFSSAEEEGWLRCRGAGRGMEDPGGGQERKRARGIG